MYFFTIKTISEMTDETRIPDPSSASYTPRALNYGMIGSGVLIVVGLIMYLAGLSDPAEQQGAVGWITNIINAVVMIWAIHMAMKTHRDEDLGGYMTYGRALSAGTVTSLVMAAVTFVWMLVFFTLIAPEMLDQIKELQIAQMEQQGMTDEQIEQAMEMAGMLTSPVGLAIMGAIGTFILGFILSLIIAAVDRNNPPETA